jgi:two-component system sensor histidine kinase BaeS
VNTLADRLRAAEEQRAALDRERRELTTSVSHDLRTPLASLRAMVEALDDRVVDDPEEVERYHGTMRREIERLSQMIDDLFEVAQMDSGAVRLNRQPIALQEIAAEAIDAMQARARQDDITLRLTVTGSPPKVHLDGTRIERAIGNLLRNAMEHTPAGGRVEVSVMAENGSIDLRVSDTGEGIAAEDLPYIWDRFYRAEKSRRRSRGTNDGAGLGLTIVRGIVEAHGGTVHAASSHGRGATFTVRLPTEAQ